RGESANYIGARSVTAAIKPDIKLQPTRHVKTMDALQTGCVHIKTVSKRVINGKSHLAITRLAVE
ncbi:hypothetical protein, partial [Escherichia coli]|uniref:hypothetical protein n=4 Tax=Enterobacterales TaxID=91347 RepID=UPI001BB22286